VTEVAQEPPEPLGASHRPVRDDEDAGADPGPACSRRERRRRGKRVPALAGRCREVLLDVEERGAGNVAGEIELAPPLRVAELPPTVDELVAHAPVVKQSRL
jgi:hypothetical protein